MSDISRAYVPRGHFDRCIAISSPVHGTNPPLLRDALASPDHRPIIGSLPWARWPLSSHPAIMPRNAGKRLPA
jgi:hypothetical protein